MTIPSSEIPTASPQELYVNNLVTKGLVTQAETPHVNSLISTLELLKKTSHEATVTSASEVSDFSKRQTMLEIETKATELSRPDLPKQNLVEHRRLNQGMVKTALMVLVLEGCKMGESGIPDTRVAKLSELAVNYVDLFPEDTLKKFTVAPEQPQP